MEISASERERQRVEHLVLGRPRPKLAPGRKTRRSKRGAVVTLAPGIEGQVALRETWGRWAGTPETERYAAIVSVREGSLARLHQSGAIDAAQLAAADEIGGVHARIAADVQVKTASLETRIDAGRRGGGAALETFAQIRREQAYTRWRQGLGAQAAVALAMIVDDVGVAAASVRFRMHKRRAKRILIEALDAWIAIVNGRRT